MKMLTLSLMRMMTSKEKWLCEHCVCVCVCMRTCVPAHVCVHVYVRTRACACVCVYAYTYTTHIAMKDTIGSMSN